MNLITSNVAFLTPIVEIVYIICNSSPVELMFTSIFCSHFLHDSFKTEI